MLCISVFLLSVCNVFAYIKVQVAYVAPGGTSQNVSGVGASDKPWSQMGLAISFSNVPTNQPDLLKVLVRSGSYSDIRAQSMALGITTDYEIIGSIDGEIATHKTRMEDGPTEDTKYDLDCVNTYQTFSGTGEFMTITNNQTLSIRRMRILSSNSTGSIFRVKLGHLIARKIYFSGEGRQVSIEYVHGSVSIYYCYFAGTDKATQGFINAIGGQNVYLFQCRFLNTTTAAGTNGSLSPLFFNNITNLTIQSCKFSSLYADGAFSEGGAVRIDHPRRVILQSCSFDKCRATRSGGALMISNIDCGVFNLLFISCVFVENQANNSYGHQIGFHYQWDMCSVQLTGAYKSPSGVGGVQIHGLYNLGAYVLDHLLSERDVPPYVTGVAPDGSCNTKDYFDPGSGTTLKPEKKPGDNTTAEAARQLSNILLVFLIIITIVVAIIGVVVCIYLVVTMIQGLNKPARVATKDLNETEAEAYYNQIDGYEIEQVAHDEDGVTIIGEEEHVQKGGSKWAKKWAAIANRANKKNKFGVEPSANGKGQEDDGPNPDDLASSVASSGAKKKSLKKDKSGWSTGYSEYDGEYSSASGYGYGSGYSAYGSGYSNSGYSNSGYSGSGASGYSGSGASGYSNSGYSGSGASGYSGSDASGYSGSGASGYSGSGASGYSGSGASGYSGSGASGYSGSGASGYSGSGASGYSGSGASGYSGSGASGYSGSGASGYSGSGASASGYSGSGASGYSGSGASGYSDASGYGNPSASGYADASGYSNPSASGYSGAGASGYSDGGYSGSGASGYTEGSAASKSSKASKSKRSNSKASKRSESSDTSSHASKSKRSKASKTKKSHK